MVDGCEPVFTSTRTGAVRLLVSNAHMLDERILNLERATPRPSGVARRVPAVGM
jgi:hypothetical protein